ncbi:MAG: MEMO1 family protein [Candidatus Micrarchaeota archaeon]
MRYPVVAGAFYTSDKASLEREVDGYLKGARMGARKEARGIAAGVAPHAGYMYSGWVAAFTYARIAEEYASAPTFVIVGPNHTGEGSALAVSLQDWVTPLGEVKNDKELARAVQKNSNLIDFDESAHLHEHSIEVQLPFLQRVYKNFSFVPICMMMQDAETAEDVGRAVAKGARELKREVVLIASSDFTHYESAASANKKDKLALGAIERMDVRAFLETIERERISVCGYAPIGAAIVYAKEMGAKRASVEKYATSGDITHDYAAVVGYASVLFRK